MKRLAALLFILCLSSAVFAFAEPDPYASSDYVNSMSPEDLVKAITDDRIKDVSIVSDKNLANAIEYDPQVSKLLRDYDLGRALNKKDSLMDTQSIFRLVSDRAQKNTYILNEYPNVKKKWFAYFQITDKGAKLDSFDGTTIVTSGRSSTQFKARDFPGAKVLSNGKLVLESGTELMGSVQSSNGEIAVTGSNKMEAKITINGDDKAKYKAINGEIIYDDLRYSAINGNVEIYKDGKTLVISGSKVQEFQQNGHRYTMTAEINGEIKRYNDGHFTLMDNSNYQLYNSQRLPSTMFQTDKPTDIYIFDGRKMPSNFNCGGSTACVVQDYSSGQMKVYPVANTNLQIEARDFSIRNLEVSKITDNSQLIYKDKGSVEVTFKNDNKNPISYKGDLNMLYSGINAYSAVNGKAAQYIFENGKCSLCMSPCKDVGKVIQVPKNGHSVKSIVQLNVNPGKNGLYYDEATKKWITSGETALKGQLAAEYKGTYTFNAVAPEDTIPANPDVAIILGHHWNGQGNIWGQTTSGESVSAYLDRLPQAKVYVFGSCHTCQNPEHLYDDVESMSNNNPDLIIETDGGFQYRTSEAAIQDMQRNNPNLRLVVGYQTAAPLYDNFLPEALSTENLAILNNQGYEAFMGKVTKTATDNYGKHPDTLQEVSLPAGRYVRPQNTNPDGQHSADYLTPTGVKEQTRIGFYYKNDKNEWKYYSWDHPQGIKMDFQKSNAIYAQAQKDTAAGNAKLTTR